MKLCILCDARKFCKKQGIKKDSLKCELTILGITQENIKCFISDEVIRKLASE